MATTASRDPRTNPGASGPTSGSLAPAVSVVLPCLNEAGSVGAVVADARRALAEAGLDAEVVVADNGSTDGSAELAIAAGARVVDAPARGYGNAYHAGMRAAQGRVLVMADADGTYPMEAIGELVGPILADELDMVIGSRLRGPISRGAMPWAHRHVGTPALTFVLNRVCGAVVSDAHSGMRAIGADAYRRLALRSPGMEYASEMILKAARTRLRIGERPISYRPRVGDSKLHPWPDGWRHLKLLLLASPNWLFLIPGVALFLIGAVLLVPLAFGPVLLGPVHVVFHPMIFGSALMLVGFQIAEFGLLARACSPLASTRGDRLAGWLQDKLTIEKPLLVGAGILLAGAAIGVQIFIGWALSGFGPLGELRLGIVALTLCVLGVQVIFGAFLYAVFLPQRFVGGVLVTAGLEEAGLEGSPAERVAG